MQIQYVDRALGATDDGITTVRRAAEVLVPYGLWPWGHPAVGQAQIHHRGLRAADGQARFGQQDSGFVAELGD
jgi:hypothetical protein